MAGMPGLSVAFVFDGAQVITLIVSSAPPVPGITPQPAMSDAAATSAPAVNAVALAGLLEK
ncbi:hypothetical protein GCM10010121_048880 [Streptomyces brasiliensis]|uniref:Uncharacterized protein n=1 Tax=Streptomyces brasiliensis TaxID=1954 RepID=A0A917KYA1_9ACTN|nr:hypothetical protein GCM10010121_048880 [Streptomyces brasiliensis]